MMKINQRPSGDSQRRFYESGDARPHAAVGFTLIELLVTVSIISLLIAILLPSLRKVRWQARRVVCQTKLAEIAKAKHMYLDDNRGRFFQAVDAQINLGGRQGEGLPEYRVPKPLNPYCGLPETVSVGAELFQCPSDGGSVYGTPTHFEFYGTSYYTNLNLVGQEQRLALPFDPCKTMLKKINDRLRDLPLSSVTTNPSSLILIGDYGWWQEAFFASSLEVEWHHKLCSHNAAFLDGHTEFLKIHKGMHQTSEYAIIPFHDLHPLATDCQEEESCK